MISDQELLNEIKDYLKISSSEEDQLVLSMMNISKSKLEQVVGVEIDFSEDLIAKGLLLDSVRYRYSNASEYFEENFKDELVSLQIKYLKKCMEG